MIGSRRFGTYGESGSSTPGTASATLTITSSMEAEGLSYSPAPFSYGPSFGLGGKKGASRKKVDKTVEPAIEFTIIAKATVVSSASCTISSPPLTIGGTVGRPSVTSTGEAQLIGGRSRLSAKPTNISSAGSNLVVFTMEQVRAVSVVDASATITNGTDEVEDDDMEVMETLERIFSNSSWN